jgi:hypothetical protein
MSSCKRSCGSLGLQGAIAFALYEHARVLKIISVLLKNLYAIAQVSAASIITCSHSVCLSSCVFCGRTVMCFNRLFPSAIFTTIVCGLTDVMLTIFGMKEHSADDNGANDDEHDDGRWYYESGFIHATVQ